MSFCGLPPVACRRDSRCLAQPVRRCSAAGWYLSSVAEGVVGFGEDPVAGYEMQGRPSRGLGSVHGEPHNNATQQPDKTLVADQLSGNGSPSPSVVHGLDRDCSSLPVMGG